MNENLKYVGKMFSSLFTMSIGLGIVAVGAYEFVITAIHGDY